MTYNVFGGTLNSTLLLQIGFLGPSDYSQAHESNMPVVGIIGFCAFKNVLL